VATQDVSALRPPPAGRVGGRRRGVLQVWVRYGVTLAAVVVLVFLLPRLMPGDPLTAFEDAETPLTPEARLQLAAHYGLDQPLHVQFTRYLGNLARGDLGRSIVHGLPVAELIRQRVPYTLLLSLSALLAASLVSFLAGVTAAWRRNGRQDRLLVVGSATINAIPDYVIAILLLMGLAVFVPIFPLAGAYTPFADHPTVLHRLLDVGYHLVLPCAALTISLLGSKFLLVRNVTIGALGEDFMVLARGKGLPERVQKYRHAGRNALLPFTTILGMQIAFAISGSLFIETVFAYYGMASLMSGAIEARDYPILEGSFLVLATVTIVMNLVVDLVYTRLDPRAARR
jgi:peptide/nickel transport system permease protein